MFTYARTGQNNATKSPIEKKTDKTAAVPNVTGIPDSMKTHFESLSGFSFDDVRVHYNSGKPARMQALAYTQGNQVYLGAGQEQHLGHELGHVVQQKRQPPAPQEIVNGLAVNNDPRLESEADQLSAATVQRFSSRTPVKTPKPSSFNVVQRMSVAIKNSNPPGMPQYTFERHKKEGWHKVNEAKKILNELKDDAKLSDLIKENVEYDIAAALSKVEEKDTRTLADYQKELEKDAETSSLIDDIIEGDAVLKALGVSAFKDELSAEVELINMIKPLVETKQHTPPESQTSDADQGTVTKQSEKELTEDSTLSNVSGCTDILAEVKKWTSATTIATVLKSKVATELLKVNELITALNSVTPADKTMESHQSELRTKKQLLEKIRAHKGKKEGQASTDTTTTDAPDTAGSAESQAKEETVGDFKKSLKKGNALLSLVNYASNDTTKSIGDIKKTGDYKKYAEKSGYEDAGHDDYKMDALHFIALKAEKEASATDDKKGLGPHIALSVVGGNIFASINSYFNVGTYGTRKTGDEVRTTIRSSIESFTDGDITEIIEGGRKERDVRTARKSRYEAGNDFSKLRKDSIRAWINKIKAYPIKVVTLDTSVEIANDAQKKHIRDPYKEGSCSGSMHGEMLISRHLKSNPQKLMPDGTSSTDKRLFDERKKHSDSSMLRVIRIGGTLIDCGDCSAAHHGGTHEKGIVHKVHAYVRVESPSSQATTRSQATPSSQATTSPDTTLDGFMSHDEQFSKDSDIKSVVLSSKEKGSSFPGWALPRESQSQS